MCLCVCKIIQGQIKVIDFAVDLVPVFGHKFSRPRALCS